MKQQLSRLTFWLVCLLVLGSFSTGTASAWKFGPFHHRTKSEMRAEIDQWARQYCSITYEALHTCTKEIKIKKRYEDSRLIMDRYEELKKVYESQARKLEKLTVPIEAKEVNTKTISYLRQTASGVQRVIDDIYHASNRGLFINAIARFHGKLAELTQDLLATTDKSHPYAKEKLEDCSKEIYAEMEKAGLK